MAYNDENISDKLKKRAGTDFADFDDERINRMYEAGMMAGSSRNRGPSRASNGSAQRGRGGQQDEAKAYFNDIFYGEKSDDFFDALTDTAAAAEAAGIKRVDSDKDLAEIRRKVNNEYMKRMIGDGVDGYAKESDMDTPQEIAEEISPTFKTSSTFNDAQDSVNKYNDDLSNYGDGLFTSRDKNYLDSYKIDLGDKVNSSSKAKDFENIRDSYRLFS